MAERRTGTAGSLALAATGVASAAALMALVVAGTRTPATAEMAVTPEPYQIERSADGRSIVLAGVIDFGATRRMTELVEGSPGVRLVRLESPGGRVAEARGLARLIERHGLDTVAEGDCTSVCTLVFVSGQKRHLPPGARLGFHRYAMLGPLAVMMRDPARELEKDFDTFRRRAVPESFLDTVRATPHDTMWYPGAAELVQANVVDVLAAAE
jgi:hypothetical protein